MNSAFELIGSYRRYNFLRVGDRFCALPQAVGAVSPADRELLHGPFALWADRIEALNDLVDRHGAWDAFDPVYSPTRLDEEGPPEVVEIELMHTCNLRCIMCHVSYETMTKQRLDPSFVDRLGGLKGKWAKLGSMYEPVAHPQFAQILQGLTRQGMKIDFISNGTLFTPKLIAEIADCGIQTVTISFDGARRETYEKIRRRAYYDLALERTLAFKEAVHAINAKVSFQVNFTVLRSNIGEIVEAVDLWERYGFDHIGFISMVLPVGSGDIIDESPQLAQKELQQMMIEAARRVVERGYRITLSSPWFHHEAIRAAFPKNVGMFGAGLVGSNRPDIRWPVTPSSYFQNGPFPGMPVNCRSPYKFARINYDGTVRLCHKFNVGSIYEADLLTIWENDAAKSLRAEVREDGQICQSCEYFKFCIRAGQVDYSDSTAFSSGDRVEVLEEHPRFSVIRYERAFYMCPIPCEVAPEDLLSKMRRRDLRIERTETIEEARQLGEAYTERQVFRHIDVIEQHPHFNILRHDGHLYVCPKPNRVDARDLTNELRRRKFGIEIAESIEDARRRGRVSAAVYQPLDTVDYGTVDQSKAVLAEDSFSRRLGPRVIAAIRRNLPRR